MIGDFLKPPTDNLYKFMCICGLILFLVSLTYPPWLLHRTTLASYDAQRDSELLDLELEESKRREKAFETQLAEEDKENPRIDAKIAAANEQLKRKRLSPSERSNILAELKEMLPALDERAKRRTALLNAFKETSTNIQTKSVELRYKTRIVLLELWLSRCALIMCVIGCLLGLLIGRKGFNLWSLRVQVYQDAILKKQAAIETESGTTDQPTPEAT